MVIFSHRVFGTRSRCGPRPLPLPTVHRPSGQPARDCEKPHRPQSRSRDHPERQTHKCISNGRIVMVLSEVSHANASI